MKQTAKVYVYCVIAAGGCVLAGALANWSSPDPLTWTIYLLLSVLASVVKLRLPGMEGTYSLGFLLLLYGVVHFQLPETLLAVGAAGVAGTLLNTKKRPSPIQVLFNIGNLIVSTGACFLLARVCLASGMAHYLPAVLAIVACGYFVINTAAVSGVLSLLQGKPLAEVCSQWYVWSFPYYLIGVALVGLFPSPGQALPGEAWLVLVPLVYLVHFFVGLLDWHTGSNSTEDQSEPSLPPAARAFVTSVVAGGALLLGVAAFEWNSESPLRFVTLLALAVAASTLKIRLPGVQGAISPNFVLILVAVTEMSFGEAVVMATLVGAVQVLWRTLRRPTLSQVLFNPAILALGAGLAYLASRIALEPWLGHSVVAKLVAATLVLFTSNTLMVTAVLALTGREPLASVWRICYFWSLPYYLVGAAVAGIMTAAWRTADWPASLLVLPLMGLVYLSYRTHVRQAVARTAPVPVPIAA